MSLTNIIQKLCDKGEKVIESEVFCGLYYIPKNGTIAIFTEKNGRLALNMGITKEFCKELIEVCEEWS